MLGCKDDQQNYKLPDDPSVLWTDKQVYLWVWLRWGLPGQSWDRGQWHHPCDQDPVSAPPDWPQPLCTPHAAPGTLWTLPGPGWTCARGQPGTAWAPSSPVSWRVTPDHGETWQTEPGPGSHCCYQATSGSEIGWVKFNYTILTSDLLYPINSTNLSYFTQIKLKLPLIARCITRTVHEINNTPL